MTDFISNFILTFAIGIVVLTVVVFKVLLPTSDKSRDNQFSLMIGLIFFISLAVTYFITAGDDIDHTAIDLAGLGQIGDFFGGLINPLLAFATFIAVLYTLQLQLQEIRQSQEDRAKTEEMQEKTAGTLNKQIKTVEHQKFENRFFKIVDMLTTEINNVKSKRYFIMAKSLKSHKSKNLNLSFDEFSTALFQWVSKFYVFEEDAEQPYQNFHDLDSLWISVRRAVFLHSDRLYQLCDLLDLLLSEIEKDREPGHYISIIKAVLDQNILFIIAIWCSLDNVKERGEGYIHKYKNHMQRYMSLRKRIEKSELLEKLLIDTNGNLSIYVSDLNIKNLPYDLNAYGKSEYMNAYIQKNQIEVQ